MPARKPAISVLLPVYNDAGTLARAVRSIQRQSLADWELLLLDDGSTDGSPELVDRLAGQDARIRPVHLPHQGIAATLNFGINQAEAPYLARMDADDVSHPRRLSLQKAYLDERPEVCVVGCKVRIFPRRRLAPGMLAYEAWLNSLVGPEEIGREIFVESPLAHPSVMMRREPLEAAGGYRQGGPEDYDLWLRLHRMGLRFGKVPRVLFWWMDRPDRLTRCSPDYSRQAFRACKARHLAALLGRNSPVVLAGNREAKRLGRVMEEAGLRVVGFVDVNPRRIGRERGGKPVVGYEDLPARYRGCTLLAAVGARGIREQIRDRLRALGYRELVEFLCVA